VARVDVEARQRAARLAAGAGAGDGWSGAARLGRGRRSERRRERAPGGRQALAGLWLAGASAGKRRRRGVRVEQHAEAGDAQRGRAGGAERIQAAGCAGTEAVGWRWQHGGRWSVAARMELRLRHTGGVSKT
jgi:hypothetical protein